ncbi:MAG: WecB/TagA/CpsF family glycosyltransferase [Lachnospiraceae bacterium]|jgi:N-acetylglucosaminyldiphosphoundecaprenol N-acetyl-beta-D-mannosaminyltransferase|nr:WecB/TagA/CpsF family glycosyltransferase [Lachnospiraceae bacterium]
MERENRRITILDTMIDALTIRETIDLVEEYVQRKEPLHLMGVNADKINMLGKNPRLKKIVNGCGIINADGASVVLASKFLGKQLPERVAGIDLMQDLVALSADRGYRVYFLGAKQEIVEKTAAVLKERYPDLNTVGIHNGYFEKKDWHAIYMEVKNADPDFVFVGITSPLKEYLVDYMQRQGLKCVFMGVGGSFDVISGSIPRAPVWMQKMNLEWFFRGLQEPRRLCKRYFVGNFKFIKDVFKER